MEITPFFREVRALIRQHRKIIAIASAIMFVSLFIFKATFKDMVFISAMFGIAMLSIIPKKKMRELPFEIELSIMPTVLIGTIYGSVFGAVFGAVVAALTEIISAHIDMETFFEIFGLAAVGFVSFFLSGNSIFLSGMLMTVFYALVSQGILFMMGDEQQRGEDVIQSAIYLLTNFFLFRFIAPLLLLSYTLLSEMPRKA